MGGGDLGGKGGGAGIGSIVIGASDARTSGWDFITNIGGGTTGSTDGGSVRQVASDILRRGGGWIKIFQTISPN